MKLSEKIENIALKVSSTLEDDIKDNITLTRKDGQWKAWYRGKGIGKDKDLNKLQKVIDKFVSKMVKDVKDNSITGASINKGDLVKVDTKKLEDSSPVYIKLVKKIIKKANNKPIVIEIDSKYAEIAADKYDALLGTVRVPIKALTKV